MNKFIASINLYKSIIRSTFIDDIVGKKIKTLYVNILSERNNKKQEIVKNSQKRYNNILLFYILTLKLIYDDIKKYEINLIEEDTLLCDILIRIKFFIKNDLYKKND